jgi:hypothetical protein
MNPFPPSKASEMEMIGVAFASECKVVILENGGINRFNGLAGTTVKLRLR